MSKYLCLVSLLLAVAMVNSELTTVKFGSKSRYAEISSQNIELQSFEEMGYAPTRGFLLIRQASSASTPDVDNVLRKKVGDYQKRVKELKENGKTFSPQVEDFLDWNSGPIPCKDRDLLDVGTEEAQAFASRLTGKFPKLFTTTYDAKKYPMKVMPKKRVTKSALALLKAIFKDTTFTEASLNVCSLEDALLMNEFTKSQDDEGHIYNTLKTNLEAAFKVRPNFNRMRKRFAKKLEIDETEVDYKLIQSFLESCRWENIHYKKKTKVCHFFDDEDIEILLEVDNIHWFIFTSINLNPFNAVLNCGMFDHLRRFLKSDETNRPVFPIYVGHRSNILALQQALGLNTYRKTFDTSTPMPFLANIMLVVFEKENAEDMVGFYFNESITAIPLEDGTMCQQCPISKVIKKLESFLALYNCEKYAEKKAIENKDSDVVMKDQEDEEEEKPKFFYSLPPF